MQDDSHPADDDVGNVVALEQLKDVAERRGNSRIHGNNIKAITPGFARNYSKAKGRHRQQLIGTALSKGERGRSLYTLKRWLNAILDARIFAQVGK